MIKRIMIWIIGNEQVASYTLTFCTFATTSGQTPSDTSDLLALRKASLTRRSSGDSHPLLLVKHEYNNCRRVAASIAEKKEQLLLLLITVPNKSITVHLSATEQFTYTTLFMHNRTLPTGLITYQCYITNLYAAGRKLMIFWATESPVSKRHECPCC